MVKRQSCDVANRGCGRIRLVVRQLALVVPVVGVMVLPVGVKLLGQDTARKESRPAKAAPPPTVPSPKPAKAVVPPPVASFPVQTIEFSALDATEVRFVEARRFKFEIAADTPLEKLLPVAPPIKSITGSLPAEELSQVPEVEFQAPLTKVSNEAMKHIAHQIAKVNHVNAKKSDGFMEALREARTDLAGLPFAMGDACRTKGERSRQFAHAVALVRAALGGRSLDVAVSPPPAPVPAPPRPQPPQTNAPAAPVLPPAPIAAPPGANPGIVAGTTGSNPVVVRTVREFVVTENAVAFARAGADRPSADKFWQQYQTACAKEDKTSPAVDRDRCENVTLARIAALMQVLAPEAPAMRLGLVKYLSAISHPEATRALARLAIFSAEDEVRHAAIDALKVRRERDYTDVLLQGLRYPWPAVARRASEALVTLERSDLVPKLVALLDEPDPRAPVLKEVKNKQVPVVRELVRVNHHRNCLLCHAPANTGNVSPEVVTAAVPVPNQPLPSPSEGYDQSSPDIQIRVDVTYLRQDFSMLQAVADAHPWPEMQRFDFLVRSRVLDEKEAAGYRERFAKEDPSRPSPYHRAALLALRELTGRDAAPTAEAWRRILASSARN
jgi:hypothetical protein